VYKGNQCHGTKYKIQVELKDKALVPSVCFNLAAKVKGTIKIVLYILFKYKYTHSKKMCFRIHLMKYSGQQKHRPSA